MAETRLCDQCLAARNVACPDSMNYRNFTGSAAWPLTILTHDQRITMGERSDWCAMDGFTFESVGIDFMHNCFLGTAKDLIGSGLQLLIQQHVFDHVEGCQDDLDKLLGWVHREMVRDCKNHGSFSLISFLG